MTAQGQPRSSDSGDRSYGRLRVYTAFVSGVGGLVLLWSLGHLSPALPDVLVFVALVVIAELMTTEAVTSQVAFSMSTAVAFASVLLFGVLPACLVGGVGGFVTTLVKEYRDRLRDRQSDVPWPRRVLFNMAASGLAVAAAGEVYLLLGGKVGQFMALPNALPIALASITAEFANAALVVGAVHFQTGEPAFRIWRQNVSWAIPINVLGMAIGGSGLALGYQTTGILGGVVFFLPIAMMIYAFRLYARQTKEQMSRLEETIAERERVEAELEASLREKETLLQEIHHRVKNNLQIMSSLISLQSRQVADRSSRDILQESQNRIRSMALIHEELYRSEDLSRIDFAHYLRTLSTHLVQSYRTGRQPVTVDVEADEIFLDIDTAIPCGLILNELVSNALKYAFVDDEGGGIHVEARSRDHEVTLTVADDGVGMPSALDLRDTGSLGLQLVVTLVEQLEGALELSGEDGTTFEITFSAGKGARG